MKKPFLILFVLFYLLTNAGISVSIHYCKGKLEYFRIITELGSCSHEHDEDPDSCCDDKNFYYQNISEQVLTQSLRISFEDLTSTIRKQNTNDNLVLTSKEFLSGNYNLPPPKARPFWLLNCSLTYYG